MIRCSHFNGFSGCLLALLNIHTKKINVNNVNNVNHVEFNTLIVQRTLSVGI